MKVSGLLKLLEERDVKLYEICELEIPFKDVIGYRIRNAEQAIFKRRNLFFEQLFSSQDIPSQIEKFRISINGEIKEIRGIIFTFSLYNTISFLCKYYVDGNKEIDNLIKITGSKEKGIEMAIKKKPLNFIVFLSEEEPLSLEEIHSCINYKGYTLFTNPNYGDSILSIYREKYIKFKNYKIPRLEFLLFPYVFEDRPNFAYFMRRRFKKGRRIKEDSFFLRNNSNVIYYDGYRFKILKTLPSELIKRFDKDGKINENPFFEHFIGYNFLKFECFVPFKRKIKNRISLKTIKNPFNSRVIFVLDSRVPVNFKKIKVIDDERIIYALNYLEKRERILENFPIVYFHPSVREDTEFLIVAGL